MAIKVTTLEDVDTFTNADGWHVDNHRQLHVFKKAAGGTSDSVASYAAGEWRDVSIHEAPTA